MKRYEKVWTFAKFKTQSPTWHATAEFLRRKHVWRDLKQWVVDIIASLFREVWEGNGFIGSATAWHPSVDSFSRVADKSDATIIYVIQLQKMQAVDFSW